MKIATIAFEIAGGAEKVFLLTGFLVRHQRSFVGQVTEILLGAFESAVQRSKSYAFLSRFTELDFSAPF
jgi:hypothetical protein